MKIKLGAVSLVALSLMAGVALAQEGEPAPGEVQTEQAAPAAEPAAEPAPETAAEVGQPAAADPIPEEVLALLNDTRPVADIDAAELRNRARAARNFAKQQGLPDDVRAKLQEIAQTARAELDARANQPKKAEEPAAAEQPPAPAEPPVEQAAPVEQPPAPAQQPVEQAAPLEQPPAPVEQPVVRDAEPVAERSQPAIVERPVERRPEPVAEAAPAVVAADDAAPIAKPPRRRAAQAPAGERFQEHDQPTFLRRAPRRTKADAKPDGESDGDAPKSGE